MKEQLIELLETFGYPVRLQGSLAPDEPYPESFFTFWNDDTPDGAHYNNDAIAFIWTFSIFFFSADPEKVNSMMPAVRALLRSHGWMVQGLGYDAPSDEKTHTGRGITALYIQNNRR